MDMVKLIEKVKRHPRFCEAGMVLCHNGVVRATSREGRPVTGLRITVDPARLEAIIAENRARPGIVDIQVEICVDRDLQVGDDVMLLVVAGDIRERVIATLHATLDAIKTEATRKTQFFISREDAVAAGESSLDER